LEREKDGLGRFNIASRVSDGKCIFGRPLKEVHAELAEDAENVLPLCFLCEHCVKFIDETAGLRHLLYGYTR
jgi:hypothetical protein